MRWLMLIDLIDLKCSLHFFFRSSSINNRGLKYTAYYYLLFHILYRTLSRFRSSTAPFGNPSIRVIGKSLTFANNPRKRKKTRGSVDWKRRHPWASHPFGPTRLPFFIRLMVPGFLCTASQDWNLNWFVRLFPKISSACVSSLARCLSFK